MTFTLRRLAPEDLPEPRKSAIDAETLAQATVIVDDVRRRGEKALRHHAERLGDLPSKAPLVLGPEALQSALASLFASERALLERTTARIRQFAEAQRRCFQELEFSIPGGKAGHWIAPLEKVGCYAPGGRFPLPSSVLMTAVTARAAGVAELWVASPRPTSLTLAAAALAEADGFLVVGGAQAIAALAYGAGPVPACDIVVGPGNSWVTAAKQVVSGQVAIDMLAGPSELLVLADATADAQIIAADLLAQAEHDPDALPVLVSLDKGLVDRVEAALQSQLQALPDPEVARAAMNKGFAVTVTDLESALLICDRLAPEHLELLLEAPDEAARRVRNYGALFIGSGSAEVLGDYGAGPNHVLPTGGGARFTGGLSVLNFLRVRTWMRIGELGAARELLGDARDLARLEGLEAHARAAERRWEGTAEESQPR